jgi:RNA polymerase sigma factor (sigma-70 family)
MREAQLGDAEAYAELLRDLTVRLRRIVARLRNFLNVEDVEDVVQEVLLSIHTVRATYDADRPFMPWVLAIVRNRLADAARRDARRAAREVVDADLIVTFQGPEPNTEVPEHYDPEALRRAIAELPAGQRQAIDLLKLQGLSLEAAASVTGQSVGALKVATHRAVVALRRKLKRE